MVSRYVELNHNLPYEQSTDWWELRVHVDPKALTEGDSNNKFEMIKAIVLHVFGKDNVQPKLFKIDPQDKEGYDGALSSFAKDRTQIGKEVGIYLPNAGVEQLSAQEYKEKLLTLWQLLQANDIPLLHLNLPGDRSINIGQSNVPSPFSFTSKAPNRNEWEDKHGITFKEFVPCSDNHPILAVQLTLEDISQHGIQLTSDDSLSNSRIFLAEHQQQVNQVITAKLETVNNQDNYREFLFEDQRTKNYLKELNDALNLKRNQCESQAEKGRKAVEFEDSLEFDETYQRLIQSYPHNSDKDFSRVANHALLARGYKKGKLTNEQIDEYIDSLRAAYLQRVDEIYNDFKEHGIIFDDTSDEKLRELINKNPAAMQSIFRNKAIINQELKQNNTISSKELNILLLESYKTEREYKTNEQYFSFFGAASRLFGAWSKVEKFAAVDALIGVIRDNKDGNVKLDPVHLGPLKQGNLGRLIQKLGVDLSNISLIEHEKLPLLNEMKV